MQQISLTPSFPKREGTADIAIILSSWYSNKAALRHAQDAWIFRAVRGGMTKPFGVSLGGCPSNASPEANHLGFFGCFSFGSEITQTSS